jgi:uncharacterized protein YdgA (DUF945 family)
MSVNPFLLRAGCFAALIALAPAFAADTKPADLSLLGSQALSATLSAIRELKANDDVKLSLPERFARVNAFVYSPETSAKLNKVYGTDHPINFTSMAAPKGQQRFHFSLMPLHYADTDGTTVDWPELGADLLLDQHGKRLTTKANWASVQGEDKSMSVDVRDVAFSAQERQGYAKLWFGNGQMTIGSITLHGKTNGITGKLEGIRVESTVAEKPRSIEYRTATTIKAVNVADTQVDDIHAAFRIRNIDKAALGRFVTATRNAKLTSLPMDRQVKAMMPMFEDLARAAILHGASIDIEDISASFQGSRASIKGHVGFEGVGAADLAAIPTFIKKIVARFEVRVPVALVRAVSGKIAHEQLANQHPGTTPDAQSTAQMAQTMTDVVVGKLINSGYARIVNDVLVSTIEWRGGKLRANGKEVILPKSPQPSAQPSRSLLQARRIEGSCQLPDYPADVVRDDKPLALTLRVTVGDDGKPRKVEVIAPSAFPAYDQAVQSAATTCTYLPALLNGKPIDAQLLWHLTREPGSTHPK